jgi:hypothetical protein
MDRRAFLTSALLSAGFAALSAGAAAAMPILPAQEAVAPESNAEKTYWVWRRPYWRRRYYHWHPYRRWWWRRHYWRHHYWHRPY